MRRLRRWEVGGGLERVRLSVVVVVRLKDGNRRGGARVGGESIGDGDGDVGNVVACWVPKVISSMSENVKRSINIFFLFVFLSHWKTVNSFFRNRKRQNAPLSVFAEFFHHIPNMRKERND